LCSNAALDGSTALRSRGASILGQLLTELAIDNRLALINLTRQPLVRASHPTGGTPVVVHSALAGSSLAGRAADRIGARLVVITGNMTEALIVVDMQNLFVDAVAGDGPRVLTEVNREVASAVEHGMPVFYTRDYAPVELPDGDPERRTALHPGLDVRGIVVDKGPGKQGAFSGFLLAPVRTPQVPDDLGGLGQLAPRLRRTGASKVTVVGIATDVCVASTARDAVRLGYSASIALRATSPIDPARLSDTIDRIRADGVQVRD
jgi:nicotinamidase/pyrazinamidase